MIGLKFLRHRNRFLAGVRRRYYSAETSDSRKYVCVRRLHRVVIVAVISNRPRAGRSSDIKITSSSYFLNNKGKKEDIKAHVIDARMA